MDGNTGQTLNDVQAQGYLNTAIATLTTTTIDPQNAGGGQSFDVTTDFNIVHDYGPFVTRVNVYYGATPSQPNQAPQFQGQSNVPPTENVINFNVDNMALYTSTDANGQIHLGSMKGPAALAHEILHTLGLDDHRSQQWGDIMDGGRGVSLTYFDVYSIIHGSDQPLGFDHTVLVNQDHSINVTYNTPAVISVLDSIGENFLSSLQDGTISSVALANYFDAVNAQFSYYPDDDPGLGTVFLSSGALTWVPGDDITEEDLGYFSNSTIVSPQGGSGSGDVWIIALRDPFPSDIYPEPHIAGRPEK